MNVMVMFPVTLKINVGANAQSTTVPASVEVPAGIPGTFAPNSCSSWSTKRITACCCGTLTSESKSFCLFKNGISA